MPRFGPLTDGAGRRGRGSVGSHVVGNSPFGVRLRRLLAHRRPSFGSSIEQTRDVLGREAGVSSAELAAVVKDGAVPSPDLVGKLAPVLGIHTADLFVVAGLPA